MELKVNFVDFYNKQIYPALINFDEKINFIKKIDEKCKNYILPGLIDSHIHIESSMLTPSRFAYVAITHGTTAVVTDPHEIANVLGIDGINFMRNDAKKTPLKFFFTAPSCVPSTIFETSGASLDSEKINLLLQEEDVVALGEMMNFYGVVNKESEVIKKIELGHKYRKPVDGHCPGLTGEKLQKYINAGIVTEHECTELVEAEKKLNKGMKIMIRQGSYAKNMENIYPLAYDHPDECFLVSDDLEADDLLKGHMNLKLKEIVNYGIDPFDAIRMTTLNPAKHYNLNVGLLMQGDPADFIIVNNLKDFDVLETYIDGKLVAKNSKPFFELSEIKKMNLFDIKQKKVNDFVIKSDKKNGMIKVNVIGIIENQIITKKLIETLKIENYEVLSDPEKDILKIAVAERYGHNNLALGFIKGFKLKEGAVASSIAHDSHNIISIGVNNEDINTAINTIIKMQGGLTIVRDNKVLIKLSLPIAGLMSDKPAEQVVKKLNKFHIILKKLGCTLSSPTIILSFMALPVIPELKLTDKGLFDVQKFSFIDLFKEMN
jgi:adenine deaminase